jgi:hypothetical protein
MRYSSFPDLTGKPSSYNIEQSTNPLPRTRPAALVLFLLASCTAEMLSGSTPILVFFTNPISLIFNPLFYGCGALLIREIARRIGLGWNSILWMGAAYGIFEEGLSLNTWARPWAEVVCRNPNDLCDYSRVGGLNTIWALELTVFHAIVSITIPIMLIEFVYPNRAKRSWIGTKTIVGCIIGLFLCLIGGLLLNIYDFRTYGQVIPLGPYLLEVVLIITCITIALNQKPYSGGVSEKKIPGMWGLRTIGFFGIIFSTLSPIIYKGMQIPFELAIAINLAIYALVCWRITLWSRRAGWNEKHMMALISGILGFFIFIWDPILELLGQAGGGSTRGTILVALAYLIFLIVVARRTARRIRQTIEQQKKEAAVIRDNIAAI